MQLIHTAGFAFLLSVASVICGVVPPQHLSELHVISQDQQQYQQLPIQEPENPAEPQQQLYTLVIPIGEEMARQISTDNYHIQVQLTESGQAPIQSHGGRVRRQLSGGVVHDKSVGTTVNAQATGTMWRSQDGQGRVNANGHWERTYNTPGGGHGPHIYGGGVDYDHARRGGGGLDVSRSSMGTQVTGQGRGTVWQSPNGNSRVDAYGQYSRNFGGPYGTGRPNYGAGAVFTHKFG